MHYNMGSLRNVTVIKPNSHEEEHASSTQNDAQTSNCLNHLYSAASLHVKRASRVWFAQILMQ